MEEQPGRQELNQRDKKKKANLTKSSKSVFEKCHGTIDFKLQKLLNTIQSCN